MTQYELSRAGDVPLSFSGEKIAEVSTRRQGPRWTELRLYRTACGSFVAEQVGMTTVEGEIDRRSAWVCYKPEDVRKTLGKGPLATELYEQAGFDGVERVR